MEIDESKHLSDSAMKEEELSDSDVSGSKVDNSSNLNSSSVRLDQSKMSWARMTGGKSEFMASQKSKQDVPQFKRDLDRYKTRNFEKSIV